MHFCFVSTSRGSYFMTELLRAISAATVSSGHTAEIVYDEYPRGDGERTYVVIPHEFHAWGNPRGFPRPEQRARTIALCTENPGTEWFEATYQLVEEFGVAASINRSSATELQRRGILCAHLQLGYTPLWDTWSRKESSERPLDALYLGAADPRRDPLLAGIGSRLWARECQFLVPPLEPRSGPRPDFLKGTDKYHRLRSAKILLNLHRTTSAAFEWMRFLEAICNGCVVVSEPCLDNEPLLADEHFVEVEVGSMAGVVERLLDDPERLRELSAQAYDFVRSELPMTAAGERLGELAAELPRRPPRTGSQFYASAQPPQTPALESPEAFDEVSEALATATETSRRAPGASRGASTGHVRGTLFRKLAKRVLRGRANGVEVVAQTPSYRDSR